MNSGMINSNESANNFEKKPRKQTFSSQTFSNYANFRLHSLFRGGRDETKKKSFRVIFCPRQIQRSAHCAAVTP